MKRLILFAALVMTISIGQSALAAATPASPSLMGGGQWAEVQRGEHEGAAAGRAVVHARKSNNPDRWPNYKHGTPRFRQAFLGAYDKAYRAEKLDGHR